MKDCIYKGVVSKARDQQRLKNILTSDIMIAQRIRPSFDLWFDENIEFGFGVGWMRGMAKKFCWYGYFAGYKKGCVK